jgi:hypothetical protein
MTDNFNRFSPITSLPPQMISIYKKDELWKKRCMDRLEQIGRAQFNDNLRFIENYEMIKGKFIFKHYIEENEYSDLVGNLTKEFDIPSNLRHYDIISQVINTLSGEYQKRPDNFRVKGVDENTTNNYIRKKTDMLLEYVTNQIEAEINQKLIDRGFEIDKQKFNSPEEKQQYEQDIQQQKQSLMPHEIEEYMKTSWMDVAEMWGEHQVELDKHRFNLSEKEKVEIEDMFATDRCFRHFFLTSNGYKQETWNPVSTFFHKSPDVQYVEDGDYVGKISYFTISGLIDKYGYLMTEDELNSLLSEDDKNYSSSSLDPYGIPYGSVIPYSSYPAGKLMTDVIGFNPAAPIQKIDSALLNNDNFNLNTRGYLHVTEGYWISQRKIGKAVFKDENNILRKVIVDENFVVPKWFKEKSYKLYDVEAENTISWTWVNQTWGGIKVSNFGTNLQEPLYLNIGPLPFQFKGDSNIYETKLPVCGQVFNARNSQSMSLVDLMKPHQIGYNIAMNQLYQIMEREIGRFIMMDPRMFPNLKDWGGENGWQKFMTVAKSLGFAPVDTSPSRTQGANAGGHFPQVIDLDETSRMLSRAKIAEFFEMQALKQVGITPQRLGNIASSETATGVNQSVTQSFAQTESYFTNFSNYKRRCLKMGLDIAQYVQSKEKDVTITYTKSDLSRAFLKLNGTDLLLSDLHVYVSNSQEDIRQLEMLRQLFMNNNTSGASPLDLATVITSNSPAEIKKQIRVSTDNMNKMREQQSQLEQQKLDQERELFDKQQENENNQSELDRENKKEIAYINTFSRQDNNLQDSNLDDMPDLLEYDKFNETINTNRTKSQIEQDKLNFKKEELLHKNMIENRKINQKQASDRNKLEIEKKKLQIVKTMKRK